MERKLRILEDCYREEAENVNCRNNYREAEVPCCRDDYKKG